jgi:glycosyltransferase involved in cell wall biosynthesis
MKVCLVAIAKNEGRFLPEWLAHYLSLGLDQIFLFDNESSDQTAQVLEAAGRSFPVTRIAWRCREEVSPQLTAYRYALKKLARGFDWICFFDCDEFLVLRVDEDIHEFLQRFDRSVGALAINWLSFGSSGRVKNDYALVADAFRKGSRRHWGNNRHIKTIARVPAILSMGIHDCVLKRGAYIHPDGQPLVMPVARGIANRIDHSLAQLNHYQIKSKADFDEKIQRGRAGKAKNDPSRFRADPEKFFNKLDRNAETYTDIDRNSERRTAILAKINSNLAAESPPSGDRWFGIPVFRLWRR